MADVSTPAQTSAPADESSEPAGPPWSTLPTHRHWLQAERDRLLRFHEHHAFDAAVGFAPLDVAGSPIRRAPRDLYLNARLVHCFAIEHLLGRPGAAAIAQHGLRALQTVFHDTEHGGWFAAVNPDGTPADTSKSAYGHAFVVLAAASATQAGLVGGRVLLDEALATIDDHLWREDEGAVIDSCHRDWTIAEPEYRGQNANMHLTEAYMAAAEATDDHQLRRRAEGIATKLINHHAREWQWRVPEHFDQDWNVVPSFNIDRPHDQFRPYGALVGHWFEWARLVLALHQLPNSRVPWAQEAAIGLFQRGVTDGWDPTNGGIVYSTDFTGRVINADRMHWAIAEGVGAAVFLAAATDDPQYEHWYRTFWDEIEHHLIDRRLGSWLHQTGPDGSFKGDTWPGKPDLYHAWQATLYACANPSVGLAEAARTGRMH